MTKTNDHKPTEAAPGAAPVAVAEPATMKVRKRRDHQGAWIHQGREVGPGEVLELDRDRADRLIRAGVVVPVDA